MASATNPFKITVSTTAVKLSGAGTRTAGRLFRNLGATSVFLGDETVTASGATQGWEVAAGEDFPDSLSNGDIYGIRVAASEDVQIWEVK